MQKAKSTLLACLGWLAVLSAVWKQLVAEWLLTTEEYILTYILQTVSVPKVAFLQATEFNGKAKELQKRPFFLSFSRFRIQVQKQHNSYFQSHFSMSIDRILLKFFSLKNVKKGTNF